MVDLLQRAATAVDYPMAALWLWDASAGDLACRAFWSAPDVDPRDVEAVKRDVHLGAESGTSAARAIGSTVAFPALWPAGSVAVLSLYAFELRVPNADLVRALTAIGEEMGRLLSRRRLELGPPLLTPRETEVLRLAANGDSGPRIAERLASGPYTVRAHFVNIYAKLGVADRAAAVAQALRAGLIE